MRKYLFCLLWLVIFYPVKSQELGAVQASGSVYLPVEYSGYTQFPLKLSNLRNLDKWDKFYEKYGDWTILFDKHTGMPHRAFGKPIKIEGISEIDNENILIASKIFLNELRRYIDFDLEELIFKSAILNNGIWYVSFAQSYKGLEVLLSEIELRITPFAQVSAFGVEYFNDIQIDTEIKVSNLDILKSALFGLKFDPKRDRIQTSELRKYILPVKTKSSLEHKLVVENEIWTELPYGKFTSYVDAHTGKLLWRLNHTKAIDATFNVNGGIKKRYPTDTETIENFSGQFISTASKSITTDAFGTGSIDLNTPEEMRIELKGPYVRVVRDSSAHNARIDTIVTPGSQMNIHWDNSNSHIFERTLFYHTNLIHSYYKKLDTKLTSMDFQMEVKLYFCNTSANSFSSGDKLIFVCVDNPDVRIGESPSVLYHEWGHSLNYFLYKTLGSPAGMLNSACNEATADITSAFMLDDPQIGRNTFFGESYKPYIRNCENNMTYPDSITYESYNDGKILSGALWDMRKQIGLNRATQLVHFAKYGKPDDLNIGKAFAEWFIDILIADDNDGDLTNGTPYFDRIARAFNMHNIGTGLFMANSFVHNSYHDTQDTVNPYIVEFDLRGMSVPGCKPEDVKLHYSTDGFDTFFAIDAKETFTGRYEVKIPAQKSGSIVNYFFSAVDPPSGKVYEFGAGTGLERKHFSFLVGYESKYINHFQEQDSSSLWLTIDEADNATQGLWELDKPNRIDLTAWGFGIMQPGSGRSGGDDKCFVTGAKGAINSYWRYVPNGRTTLTSPVYNISEFNNPVVRFHYWFYNLSRFPGLKFKTKFVVQFSSNNGDNWFDVYSGYDQTNGWEMLHFPINNYVAQSDSFRIRFIADAPLSPQGNPYCYSEVLIDDFELLNSLGESVNRVSAINAEYSPHELFCFPNPSFETMNVLVKLQYEEDIVLSVHNILGAELFQLTDEKRAEGEHIFLLKSNSITDRLPAGVYFVKLKTPTSSIVRKFIIQ